MKLNNLCWAGLMGSLLAAFAVSMPLMAGEVQSPYTIRTVELKDNMVLENGVIYRVDKNKWVRTLEVADTAIIHICEGCTLMVEGANKHAAIHVPEKKVLIISGEKNSLLDVTSGNPCGGFSGDDGKSGVPDPRSYTPNVGGAGGKGGTGGEGAGAAIGGNGGEGGEGGEGAPENSESKNNVTKDGSSGSRAHNGHVGETMGAVYIVGDVRVKAQKRIIPVNLESDKRASAGANRADGGGFWNYVSCSGGGGGGTGHSGSFGDLIGGGGPGGGGGGGGGSGSISFCNPFSTNTYFARGQGGRGGHGSPNALNGECEKAESNTSGENRGGDGGDGGWTGSSKGGQGTLRAKNIYEAFVGTKLDRWVEPIESNAKIMRMRVTYSGVNDQGAITHPSYPFYYGMNMSRTTPVPTRTNGEKFLGFYHNDTQIYNEQGRLTPAGERLLYTYNHVNLNARWVGPAHVHLELRYADANPELMGRDTIVYSVDTIFPITNPRDSMHVVFHASDYCPQGYQVLNDLNVDYYIHMGEDYRSVVRYGLKPCTMHWIVPTAENELYSHIRILNTENLLSADRTDNLRYWQNITQPALHFDSDEARLRTRFVAWQGMPAGGVMDTTAAEATLRVALLQHHLFVEEKEEHGDVRIFDGVSNAIHPDSCYYGELLSIELTPDPGYRVLSPMVNQWIGDTVGAAVAVTRVNDSLYTFLGDSTDLIVTPRFERENYHMTVDYTVVGDAPADPTVYTYAATNADHFSTSVPAEQLVFQYADYVGLTSWYAQDAIYEWVGVPVVVNTRTGDTIPVMPSLQEIAHDGQEEYYLCYLFEAPASDVAVHMTMYHRAAYQCQIYNLTDSIHIDSVMVNLNTQTLPADSILTTRELDIVTMSVQTDSSAVEAGYWDESHVYHRLPVRAEAELTPMGEYKMCYYSALAPAANMAMGVVDGLKIRLMYCDTVVRWTAPGAALAGDTVAFRVTRTHPREVVSIDSVLIYNVDNQLEFRFVDQSASGSQFVMPDSTLFVYVYAHKVGDYHTVTYLNANGDTLQHSDWHQLGDTVRYSGEIPTQDSGTDRFRWQFVGWTPELHPVTGDDVYTATYRRYVRLDETINNDTVIAAYADEIVGVDMVRPMNPKYVYTVSFPFDMTDEQMVRTWGWGTVAWELTYTELDGTQLDVHFTPADDTLRAGHPYILMPASANDLITLDSVVLTDRLDTVRTDELEFRSNAVNPFWMPEQNYQYRFLIQNKVYWSGHASGPYRALRSYFFLLCEADSHTNVILNFDGYNGMEEFDSDGLADPGAEEKQGDMPTFFESIESDNVAEAKKLLYNNQVLIRIDGRIYDILGQRVK